MGAGRKYWGRSSADLAASGRLERAVPKRNVFDRVISEVAGTLQAGLFPARRRNALVKACRDVQEVMLSLDDTERQARAAALSQAMRREGMTNAMLAQAVGLTSAVIHQHLGYAPRDEQITAALGLLRGALVEMATGEGKSLTALLAAAIAGLAGRQVHVVTVNSYLTCRDADDARPILRDLGLSTSAIYTDQDASERNQAWAARVIFADNKELAFAYLRASLALSHDHSRSRELLSTATGRRGAVHLPAMDFAIIDEADSILVDEATTPLIIAAPRTEPSTDWRGEALGLANCLEEGTHWTRTDLARTATLTPKGIDMATQLVMRRGLTGLWAVAAARREWVEQALTAQHLYQRDVDYLIDDEKVIIIDPSTGRRMPDRAWQAGLHQMVEQSEGLEQTAPRVAEAQITFRALFSRYRRLSGMTGTGKEVAGEFRASFGMGFLKIAPHRAVRRIYEGMTLCPTLQAKAEAVAQEVRRLQADGRPVLVGTQALASSETISRALTQCGVAHEVLSARDPSNEAELIFDAAQGAKVTVATNMAGRGADIPVPKDIARLGGLHVIVTEFQASKRLDRQLVGRCARSGQPGSWSAVIALDDDLFRRQAPRLSARLAQNHRGLSRVPVLIWCLIRWCQFISQTKQRSDRRMTDSQEVQRKKRLAFSGRR